VARALEGPLPLECYEGPTGSTGPNHGLPRFRSCSFAAAYPLGQVFLADPDVPLEVRIEAFNPLVPADAEASGIPFELGMTLEEVAKAVGVKKPTILRYENGVIKNIKIPMVKKIASALNTTPIELMGLENDTVKIPFADYEELRVLDAEGYLGIAKEARDKNLSPQTLKAIVDAIHEQNQRGR
jgi:transcriptional regulator with XRE-family HTH domain